MAGLIGTLAGRLRLVSHARAPWDEIHARVRVLPMGARAVFALAVAERLVAESGPELGALRSALAVGWRVALHGDGEWQKMRDELERRPDLDVDAVAVVYHALGAAAGSAEDVQWAVERGIDAAYDRVPYPEDVGVFRPLEVDTAKPAVQEELLWQRTVLDLLEESGVSREVVSRLRR
jgi:hypothetical protein